MKKIVIIFLFLLQIISHKAKSQLQSYHWFPDSIVARLHQKFPAIKKSGSIMEFGNHYTVHLVLEEENIARIIQFDSAGFFCEQKIILKKKQIPTSVNDLVVQTFPTLKIKSVQLIEKVKQAKYFLLILDSVHSYIFVKCFQEGKELRLKRLSGEYQEKIIYQFGKKVKPLRLSQVLNMDADAEIEYQLFPDTVKRISVCFNEEGKWLKTKILTSFEMLPLQIKKLLKKIIPDKKFTL